MRKLIAGNWKMNGLCAAVAEIDAIIAGLGSGDPRAEALVCPPATLLAACAGRAAGTPLGIGAQDCHTGRSGAHTGDISAEMLKDAGASHVILGHSERRAAHGELSALVNLKVLAAFGAGLVPVVCVGESLSDREAGLAEAVVLGQLDASLPREAASHPFAVAYEPVWAIGTGRTPVPGEIASVHAAIRAALVRRFGTAGDRAPVLYGGSVTPGNAAAILALDNVGGCLVGGASLKAEGFLAIWAAAVQK